ncbi:hypothetical protein DSO57_1033544 [Entomophthora muscae]|uniref:Uncharacterized protein n=1 Tax=Entomophthora muscae TaxID=34485 RepID=A0ACC2TYL2_9FUNG|nr:hypothetical protein DSO57_1033544 [Entomophthora muscae]
MTTTPSRSLAMTQDTLWGLVTRNPTAAVLTGDKFDKASAKALMAKMPEIPEKTIVCLLNIQKTVVEGLQFKSFVLSAPSFWVDNPEIYAHLKPAKRASKEDTELPVQLLVPRIAKPAEAASKEETQEGNLIKN